MLTGRENERRGTSVWCVGLPLMEERRLDREEQEARLARTYHSIRTSRTCEGTFAHRGC